MSKLLLCYLIVETAVYLKIYWWMCRQQENVLFLLQVHFLVDRWWARAHEVMTPWVGSLLWPPANTQVPPTAWPLYVIQVYQTDNSFVSVLSLLLCPCLSHCVPHLTFSDYKINVSVSTSLCVPLIPTPPPPRCMSVTDAGTALPKPVSQSIHPLGGRACGGRTGCSRGCKCWESLYHG